MKSKLILGRSEISLGVNIAQPQSNDGVRWLQYVLSLGWTLDTCNKKSFFCSGCLCDFLVICLNVCDRSCDGCNWRRLYCTTVAHIWTFQFVLFKLHQMSSIVVTIINASSSHLELGPNNNRFHSSGYCDCCVSKQNNYPTQQN